MIHINKDLCTGCGVCVKVCSMACIVMEEEKAVFKGEHPISILAKALEDRE